MIEENHKKKSGWRQATTMFFVLLLVGLFLFSGKAFAYTGDYNKLATSTLTAAEWNNLLNDFVAIRGSGHVGIGTTVPSDRLTVVGGRLVTISQDIYSGGSILSSGSGNNYIVGKLGLGTPGVGQTNLFVSGNASIGSGYSSIWTVPNPPANGLIVEGSVGIGTVDPISKLHVAGNSYFNGTATTTGYIAITGAQNTAGNLRFSTTNPYISAPSYIVIPGGLYVSGGTLYSGAQIRARAGISNDISSYLTISGGTSTATYFPGTIGIGTSNPSAPLTIQQTNDTSGFKLIGNADPTTIFSFYIGAGGSNNPRFNSTKSMVFEASNGIYFRGPSGVFINDSNTANILLASGGGNVGIGTTSPTSKLDVNGLIKMRNYTITAPEDVINKGYLDDAISSTTASIITQVATSSFWQGQLSGDIWSNNTGKVGIGTTTPSNKLDVIGSAFIDDSLFVGSTSGDRLRLYVRSDNQSVLSSGASSLYLNSAYNGIHFENSTSNEIVTFLDSGNVGIGTTSPSAALDVYGKVKTTSGGIIYNTDSARWLDMTGTLTDSLKVSGNLITTAGSVGVGTSSPSAKLDVFGKGVFGSGTALSRANQSSLSILENNNTEAALKIWQFGVASAIIGSKGNDTNFYLTNNYYNTGLGVASTSITINRDGLVGIGTTNPDTKLSINGSSAGQLTLLKLWNPGAAGDGGEVSIDLAATIGGITTGRISSLRGSNNSWSTTFSVFNGSSLGEKMRITSSGNVGIGTINPLDQLHITGNVRIGGLLSCSGTGAAVKTDASGRLVCGTVSGGVTGSGTTNYVSKWTSSNTLGNGIIYDNGTNVGIGTMAVNEKLTIASGSIKLYSLQNTADAYRYIGTEYNSGNGNNKAEIRFAIDGGDTKTRLSFHTANGAGTINEQMRITSNGNVGIGTTSPSAALDVYGKVKATSGGIIYNTDSARWLDMTGTLTDSLKVSGNLITTAGSVGVGTTNPAAKVDIYSGTTALLIGADGGALTRTNAAVKYGRIGSAHYLNAEEPTAILFTNNNSTTNTLNIGGGTGMFNAATDIRFYAADNTTTLTGTEKAKISSAGLEVSGGAKATYFYTGFNWTTKNSGLNMGVDGINGGIGFYNGSTPSSASIFRDTDSKFYVGVRGGVATSGITIDTSGNVGINNASPAATLDVAGSLKVSSAVTFSGPLYAGSGSRLIMVDDSGNLSATTTSAVLPPGTVTLPSGTNGQTLRYNNGSWVANSTIYNNGTNVGIGTTAPKSRFAVTDTMYSGNGYTVIDKGFISPVFGNELIGADLRHAMTSSNITSPENMFRLGDSNAIVNTGSTGVIELLGSWSATSAVSARKIFITPHTAGTIKVKIEIRRADDTWATAFDDYVSFNSRETKLFDFYSVAPYPAAWNIKGIRVTFSEGTSNFYINQLGLTNTQGQDFAPYLAVTGGTVYGGVNLATKTGSVGVGTASPAANSLDAYGKVKITSGGTIYNTDSARWLDMTGTLTDSLKVSADLYSTAGELKTDGTGINYMMGSLGIGTNNPANAKLQVVGDIATNNGGRISPIATDIGAANITYNATGITDARFQFNGYYGHRFDTAGGTRMVINQSGNVGIGTSNPGELLDVSKSTGGVLRLTSSDTTIAGVGEILGKVEFYTSDATPSVAGIMGSMRVVSNAAYDGSSNNGGNMIFATRYLSQGLLDRMTITNEGNVGIGTISPSAKLDVNGSIKASSATISLLGNSGNRIVMTDDEGNLYATSTTIATGLPTPSTDGSTLRSNGTSWITNTLLYNNGTSIGIGTTSPLPGSKLDVIGDGRFSGMLTLTGQGNSGSNSYGMLSDTALNIQHPSGGSSSIYFRSGVNYPSDFGYIRFEDSYTGSGENARLTIGVENDQGSNDYLLLKSRTVVDSDGFNSDNPVIMQWLSAGTERARLTSTGYLGIGTTSPEAALDVFGKIKITSTGRINNENGENWLDMTGVLTDSLKVPGDIYSTAGELKTSGTGINYMMGSLGIGTAAPAAKVHIFNSAATGTFKDSLATTIVDSADSRLQIRSTDSGTYGSGLILSTASSSWAMMAQTSSDANKFYIGYRKSSADEDILSASTKMLTIDTSGNASIAGNLNVTGTISGNSTITGTINATNVSSGEFGVTGGGGNFSFGATVPGNVGIGTLSPATRLDINYQGAINTTTPGHAKYGLHFSGQSTADYANGITWNGGSTNSNAQAGIYVQGSGAYGTKMYFATTNAYVTGAQTRMMIDQSGSVGIGTNNPAQKLHIASGNIALTNVNSTNTSQGLIKFSAPGYPASFAGIEGKTNAGGADQMDLLFYTGYGAASLEKMRILAQSGNVGINTTDPSEAKLVINAGTGLALKAYGHGVFTGTLQTQTGSDFAEEFATTKDLEPGTVVVMDDNGYKSVKPATKSYDKTVVGIVSNNPSIIAGKIDSRHKAIIAMMGVVKVKVTSVNGVISKGDLLTTSNITGYAMKTDGSKPGTVIGKALEDLKGSKGEINVLVNLQ